MKSEKRDVGFRHRSDDDLQGAKVAARYPEAAGPGKIGLPSMLPLMSISANSIWRVRTPPSVA